MIIIDPVRLYPALLRKITNPFVECASSVPAEFSELLTYPDAIQVLLYPNSTKTLLLAFKDTPFIITVISCASAGMPVNSTSVPDTDCSANNTNELPPEPLPPLPVISFPLTYN